MALSRTLRALVAPAVVTLLSTSVLGLPTGDALAVTYTYIGFNNSNWQTAVNWSPNRTIISATDVLVFQSGSITIGNVPDQTVAQVLVPTGAHIRLISELNGLRTLTIAGGTGEDLVVEAGASLGNENDAPMRLQIAPGATAAISGDIVLEGPTRFFPGNAGSVVFQNGSRCIATSTFDGTMFGTSSPFNAVVFQAGSLYESGGGSPPHGVAAPNSMVVFQPGSLYRHKTVISPSLSGRTYGNFEFDAVNTITHSLGTTATIDSIEVKHGIYSIQMGGPVNIRGSIKVADDARLILGHPTFSSLFILNGTTTQNLQLDEINFPPTSNFDGGPATTIRIDNPANVQVTNLCPALSCKLEFVRGKLIIPDLEVGHPLFLFGNADVIGASQSTGWISGGYMYAPVTPASPSRLLPMGDLDSYAPLSVTFHGLADSIYLTGATTKPSTWDNYYPYFSLAGIDTTKKVDRFMQMLFNSPAPVAFTSLDAVVGWGAADVDPGADPNAFVGRVKSFGSNFYVPFEDQTIGIRTATSMQMLGVTGSPGDINYIFLVGEPATASLMARDAQVFEDGVPAAQAGPRTEGASTLVFPVSLFPVSMSPVSVDYSVTNGTADGSDFDPVSGTLQFAPGDTVEYITVPLLGDATPERNETIQLALSNAVGGATIAQPTATGTILDDDDVTAPTVQVTAPNGGEAYAAGSVVPLYWNASDDVAVASVTLRIKRDHPQPSILIATGVPNTGSYLWTSSTELTSTARLMVTALDDRGNGASDLSDGTWSLTDPTAVETPGVFAFALGAMAPNPVAAGAAGTIEYTLPSDATVDLSVIDVRGRRVGTIASGPRAAGAHRATWNGEGLAPGLYFLRLRMPGHEAVRRVVVGI